MQELESIERLARLARLARRCPIEVRCGDYAAYAYREGDVVYCDPPYRTDQTVKRFYRNEHAKRKAEFAFDYAGFYAWCDTRDYPVYISGYEVPDGRFAAVWEREKISLYSATDNVSKRTEIVYTQRRYAPERVISSVQEQIKII